MTSPVKVALAGAGAFGIKHLDGMENIGGVEVVPVVGRERDKTAEVDRRYGIAHAGMDLADSLKLPGLDAVILCTPMQVHAKQAIDCWQAGRHVQVKIPLCDSLADGQRVVDVQKKTALVAIQQMDVQTYFSATPT